MIITESFEIKGIPFIRTYSDVRRYIVREGVEYEIAEDPAEFNRTYTEGRFIEDEDLTADEILDILLGEAE